MEQDSRVDETQLQDVLTIIVPCYNEEESLVPFIEEIDELRTRFDIDISLLFVDDGSSDRTLAILRWLTTERPLDHYISLSRNFGKEAAIYAGLQQAVDKNSRYIALIDADLQDPPHLLEEMFEMLRNDGCDSVAAYRSSRDGESRIRSFCAHTFYWTMRKFSAVNIVDGARDFRIMTHQMAKAITAMSEHSRFSKGIFEWVGFDTQWIGYKNVGRENGSTKWNLRALFDYATDGIISFSTYPLKVVSLIGVGMFAISLVFLLFIFVRALMFGDPVDGWPSLVCIITLLSGLQLLCLGVHGLYLAKAYVEVKGRPIYFIKEED